VEQAFASKRSKIVERHGPRDSPTELPRNDVHEIELRVKARKRLGCIGRHADDDHRRL
jgi:hypothetical protein